eukprot:11101102-Prorocentrum_lima.AAC.1
MTSSLVGSEMCIRDSHQGGPGDSTGTPAAATAPEPQCGTGTNSGDAAADHSPAGPSERSPATGYEPKYCKRRSLQRA